MKPFDPTDTAGQAQAAADRAERDKRNAELETGDLKWLMSDKRGRRFVCGLLERAGVWRSSFNTNGLVMAFAEGSRNEGLRLLANVTAHCPERYADMLRESKEASK